jgi:hypothetical protein
VWDPPGVWQVRSLQLLPGSELEAQHSEAVGRRQLAPSAGEFRVTYVSARARAVPTPVPPQH